MSETHVKVASCESLGGVELRLTRDVAKGEVVLVEQALATSDSLYFISKIPSFRYNERLAWTLVENLLDRKYANALIDPPANTPPYATGIADEAWEEGDTVVQDRLATFYDWEPARIRHLFDVVGTNNLTAETTTITLKNPDREMKFVTVSRLGFFPILSRVNHACAPNSTLKFDPSSPRVSLVALRPIKTGTPLTIHYLGPSASDDPETCRKQVRDTFGFVCKCSSCLECRVNTVKC